MSPPSWAYDVDNFDPPPDPELVCSICLCVFCDPVQSVCNHVFCRKCIVMWLEKTRHCPVCRKKPTNFSLHSVLPLVQNMIMNLTLRCRNVDRGCKEKLTLESCELHLRECVYEMIQCTNQPCKQMVLRKDVGLHNCSHRIIQCNICKFRHAINGIHGEGCIDAIRQYLEAPISYVLERSQSVQYQTVDIDARVSLDNSLPAINSGNHNYVPGISKNASSNSEELISREMVPELKTTQQLREPGMLNESGEPICQRDMQNNNTQAAALQVTSQVYGNYGNANMLQSTGLMESRNSNILPTYFNHRSLEQPQRGTGSTVMESNTIQSQQKKLMLESKRWVAGPSLPIYSSQVEHNVSNTYNEQSNLQSMWVIPGESPIDDSMQQQQQQKLAERFSTQLQFNPIAQQQQQVRMDVAPKNLNNQTAPCPQHQAVTSTTDIICKSERIRKGRPKQ